MLGGAYTDLVVCRGATLTIEAIGTFKEEIKEGAYVILQVKYGLIRLVNTKASVCEQIKNVDMECPIKKGKTVITKDVELPTEIPNVGRSLYLDERALLTHLQGKYTVLADVYTEDDRKITCLTAQVTFQK